MPIAMPTRWRWPEQLAQDVRFGARTLRRNPGFAATAVLTLALGLGATTAIFSILNGVLLRPLPFAEPERLVQLYGRAWREERAGAPDPLDGPLAAAELDGYARQSTSFEGFASYGLSTKHLSSGGEPERLTAVVADSSFFTLLGVAPIVGRTFRPGDPADVAVISERLWRRRFDADRALPGRTVTLDGRTFTVLGVMGDRFQFPYGAASALPAALPESRTDLWVPREPAAQRRGRAHVIARLKPGVAVGAAGAELRVIAERLERQLENPNFRVGVRVVPLREVVLGAPVRRSLWMLFAAVGLVLAAACATVANLLLTRTALRAREVATRAALGAGRARLVRQLLAESLLLALAGAAAGAVVARWGTSLLVALGAAKIPRAHEIALDWRAFGFLLAICLTTALLAGLAPAAAAARVDVQGVLRAAGGGATAGRGYGRVRDALVVTEVALAFVLSLGAALVIREVVRLRRVETGMVTAGVVTLHLTPRAPAADYYAIEDRVRQLPGVRAAGFTQLVPLQHWGWEGDFAIRGRPAPTDERLVTGLRYVTPGYFDALGVPLVRGRALGAQDVEGAPRAVVVNEALARRYFPGEDPVGRELDRGTIVGVVGDVRQVRLDRPAEPELYYPAAQNVAMTSDIGMTLVVRAAAGAGRPEALVARVRAAVREVNPGFAIFGVKTMEQVVADSLWELNLYRWLIGLFAALVLVLAATGLYGVIAYSVTSRTRELAVRLALGSGPGRLARMVLARGVRLTAIGLAAGIVGAHAAAPALEQLSAALRGDLATYAGVAGVLLAVALAACSLPAAQVAEVNPATALRHD